MQFLAKYLSLQDGLLILIITKILKIDHDSIYQKLCNYKNIREFSIINFNNFDYTICDKKQERIMEKDLLSLIKYTDFSISFNKTILDKNIHKFYKKNGRDINTPQNYNLMEVHIYDDDNTTYIETINFSGNVIKIGFNITDEKNIMFVLIIFIIYPVNSMNDINQILMFINKKSIFSELVINNIVNFFSELIRENLCFKLRYQNIMLKNMYKL